MTSFANTANSALLHSTWPIGFLQQALRNGFSMLQGAFFSVGEWWWWWQSASHTLWPVESATGNKSVAEHRVNGGTLLEKTRYVTEIEFVSTLWRLVVIVHTTEFNIKTRERQCSYKRNIEARSSNHCSRGKVMRFMYYECVCVSVVLVIQCAESMGHIVICTLSSSTLFPHIISYTSRLFREYLLNTKYVFWFSLQLFAEMFLILRKLQPDIVTNVYRPSCKVPCIVVGDEWNFEIFLQIFEKY